MRKPMLVKAIRYFIKTTNGEICTAYRTREEAEAEGEQAARLFGEKFLRVEARECMVSPRDEKKRA